MRAGQVPFSISPALLQNQPADLFPANDEQALVNANHDLITRFEQKIQNTLARVLGGDTG